MKFVAVVVFVSISLVTPDLWPSRTYFAVAVINSTVSTNTAYDDSLPSINFRVCENETPINIFGSSSSEFYGVHRAVAANWGEKSPPRC